MCIRISITVIMISRILSMVRMVISIRTNACIKGTIIIINMLSSVSMIWSATFRIASSTMRIVCFVGVAIAMIIIIINNTMNVLALLFVSFV